MARARKAIPPFYIGMITFSLGLFIATLLYSGSNGEPTEDVKNSDGLFVLQGESYGIQDLSYTAANALYQLEQEYFEQKISLLERAALYLHLDKLAAKRDVTRQTIRNELVSIAPITEQEVAKFYEDNQQQLTQPYFQVKSAIQQALQRDRLHQADQQLIDKLKQAGQLSFNVIPPSAPSVTINSAGYPAIGPATAPVTVIDFTDYNCPHCKLAAATLAKVQQQFPDKIRLITLTLPVLGKLSEYAAGAALCAHQQDQYWPLHKALFAHQDNLTTAKIDDLVTSLPIDQDAFASCFNNEEDHPLLTNAINQARRLGITGTPAIFINGIAYRDGNLQQSLANAITDAVNAGAH